jgi:hypothetical protein
MRIVLATLRSAQKQNPDEESGFVVLRQDESGERSEAVFYAQQMVFMHELSYPLQITG